MEKRPISISKLLSQNDTGETGGHQAGILVPKTNKNILAFFPALDLGTKNPRIVMHFIDDSGEMWKLNFIYYNSRFFGGTRNEYRLTGMTGYFKQNNLKAGDTIILEHNEEDENRIHYQRKIDDLVNENKGPFGIKPIKIASSHTWKVIKY